MSWYDEDENEGTSGGNDNFGFFDNSVAEAGDNPTDVNVEQSNEAGGPVGKFKNKVGKKNFALLIAMLIGTLVIVGVVLIFGNDTDSSSKKKVTPTPVPQQQQQQQQNNSSSTKYADWQDMTGASFDSGVEKTATFTVTDYKLYARSSGGAIAPLEIRVEAWGAIAGYDGIYKVDVPYATIAVIDNYEATKSEPLSFTVKFKVGTYKENKVIYDITP